VDGALSGGVVFRFGGLEIDARSGELRRGNERIALARKPTELLLLLLRRRDRVVTKAEALAAIWPDVSVSDAAFASALRDLRRALRDHSGRPRMIASVRGRGLRFIGAVEEVPGETADTAGGALGRYVGRGPLLHELYAAFESARGGSGRVVLLGGQAGIGKTRTAMEVARHARDLGATVHSALGAAGLAPPHHVWVQLLGAMARGRPAAELEALVGPHRRDVARLVPALGEAAERRDDADAVYALHHGVVEWLRAASASVPLVLVIDDLHAADRASLRLLESIAREITTLRVLVVATHRSAELEPGHPLFASLTALERLPGVEHHRLHGLGPGEAHEFAALHGGRALPRDLVEALRQRSDGNPFFLRQLVAGVAERDDADLRRNGVQQVPSTAREWVRGRLAELSPGATDCLRSAAVLGRDFALATLAHVVDLPEAALFEPLEEARRAALVGEAHADQRRFVHALIQEAIYEETPAPRRIELHERAGEALAALASADRGELLSSVAHHFGEAVTRVGARAVDAALRAAEHAERRLAFAESAHLHERALAALDRAAPHDRARRCEILLGEARALLGARDFDKACDVARRCAAVAREIGRADMLAEAAIVLSDHVVADAAELVAMLTEAIAGLDAAPAALRSRTLCALSTHLWYVSVADRRRELADRALAAAHEAGDANILAAALLAKRNAQSAPSELAQRLRLDAEAVRASERGGSEGQRCLALSWRAVDLLESGDLRAAQRDVDSIAHVVDAGRARRFLAFDMRWRSLVALMSGRFAEAQRFIGEAAARMRRIDDPNAEAYGAIPLALLMLEQGRTEEIAKLMGASGPSWFVSYLEHVTALRAGVASLEVELGRTGAAIRLLDELAADDWAALAADTEQLATISWLAEICAQLDATSLAGALYERARDWSDRFVSIYAIACRGSMARYVALLARTAGRVDEAERAFERAVEANRGVGAELYVAWSLWDWSQLLRHRKATGDVSRAAQLTRQAVSMGRSLGLTRLLRAADASRPPGPASPPQDSATSGA
jgi:DNA-binding winged helix-turn-helix (wHTH) protein